MTTHILNNRFEEFKRKKREFEEKFPSLKGKDFDDDTCGLDAIYIQDIQEHCRDNQRIEKAIGEITFIRGIEPEDNIHNAVNRERERILKELRLDK